MKINTAKYLNKFSVLEIFITSLVLLTGFALTILQILTNINSTFESILTSGQLDKLQYLIYPILFKFIAVLCLLYLSYIFYSIADSIYCHFISTEDLSNKPDVKYDLNKIISKGLSWKLYRIFSIVKLPALITLAGAFITLFFVVFFNLIMAIAGYSLFLTSFISLFALFSVVFSFLLGLFGSVWNYLISALGFECAISEPELSNFIIKKRAERLAFTNPFSILVSIASILYLVILSYQVVQIVNIPNFISWGNSRWVSTFIALNFIALGLLKYIKAKVYSDSLSIHYKNITIDSNKYYEKN